jgi:hypothetical protein
MPLVIVKLKNAFKDSKVNLLYKEFMEGERYRYPSDDKMNPKKITNLPLHANYNGFFKDKNIILLIIHRKTRLISGVFPGGLALFFFFFCNNNNNNPITVTLVLYLRLIK